MSGTATLQAAFNTSEAQLVAEGVWERIAGPMQKYRWPEPLQLEAWFYICELVQQDEDKDGREIDIAIRQAAERLNDAERYFYNRKKVHIGRMIRERLATTCYIYRHQLEDFVFPFHDKDWFKTAYRYTQEYQMARSD